MRYFVEIARTGLTSVLLHPLRSLVTVAAVLAVLLPFLVGLGISRGLLDEAEAAARHASDFHVSAEQFGRAVPISLAAAAEVRKIPGVTSVVPRIVGRIELGKDHVGAVLVGVPLKDFPPALECIEGKLHRGGPTRERQGASSGRNELVVGSDLARRLNLRVGSLIPPFYRSRKGEHVSEVVGTFRADVTLWQARLVVTSFETAARIFDQTDLATDLLVDCRPGYEEQVRQTILRQLRPAGVGGPAVPRVVSRQDLEGLLPRGPLRREGVFTVLFVFAFAVAILVVLVTSGFGMAERRQEVGLLKATGWQTDELLIRSLVESCLLALTGAALAVLVAVVWLRGLNGWWIAGIFLADSELSPGFRVPFRLTPVPAFLTFLIALVVVLTGSLYSTWRAATAPPREAMR